MATSLPQNPGAELLARAILAQAQEEGEKIRTAAKAEAEALIAQAGAEAAKRHQVAVEEEKAHAMKGKSTALALAELEAHRLFLHVREELIEQVFARVAEALTALRGEPRYADVLLQLLQDGIATLAGEEFVVEVAPEDLPLVKHVLTSPALHGKSVDAQATHGISGGCRVLQRDQRAFCDNSFTGIFARQKEQLRPLIATWLWGDEKHWRG